jgi:phage baseplate assembly protein W
MSTSFYKMPIAFDKLLQGQDLVPISLEESITQALQRIITTRFGEHRYDATYGCEVWELDFELIVSENLWEEKMRLSMMDSIIKHEKRLIQVTININISEVPYAHYSIATAQVKKQVDIKISGTMTKTGEPFIFQSKLYLSPLSVG